MTEKKQEQHSLEHTSQNTTSQVKELRVGVLGSVDSGKSTLTGVLSTGTLDDGRGLIRTKVLKHPHEQETGRTSDVSQRFIRDKNYTTDTPNGTGEKVVGFVDLAGHEKYLRTTISGVNRCSIDYAIIVVGANMGVLRMTNEHLALCLSLNIPTMIVITKTDLAPKNVYERTRKDLLDLIKKKTRGRRIPAIVKSQQEYQSSVVDKYYDNGEYNTVIPIISVSSVTGDGIDFLTNVVKGLPIYNNYEFLRTQEPDFVIESTYMVKGIGLVVSGVVHSGIIKKGDILQIGPFGDKFHTIQIKTIHNNFQEFVEQLEAGQGGCFNVKVNSKIPVRRERIRKGVRIMKHPSIFTEFRAEVKIMHHPTTIKVGYEPTIHTGCVCQAAKIVDIENGDVLRLGEKATVRFRFAHRPEYIQPQAMLVFREGRTKGIGRILEVF
jgi:small GTP-binding protein